MAQMGLKPVIDLDMRLGEGTGAALTIDIVAAACRLMGEMASFESVGVSQKSKNTGLGRKIPFVDGP